MMRLKLCNSAYVGAKMLRAAILTGVLVLVCVTGQCQAMKVRPNARLRPMDTHPDSLSLFVTPGQVNFALVPKGTAQGSSGVTITTQWSTHGSSPNLTLYGYFTSANAALSDNLVPAHLIPSSSVLGQISTGVPTTYTAFTQTNGGFGAPGASLLLLSGFQAQDGLRTDVLNLRINLGNVPNLPAGNYSGLLTIQASIQ